MIFALLTCAFAEPRQSEIGVEKKLGLGLQLGIPSSVNAKLWFDDKSGVAFHGGFFPPAYTEGRVQYEIRMIEFGRWPIGDLGLYVDAGGAFRSWLSGPYDASFSFGFHGGVGASMRFTDYPLEVFAEIDNIFYVLRTDDSPFIGIVVGPGARWYF